MSLERNVKVLALNRGNQQCEKESLSAVRVVIEQQSEDAGRARLLGGRRGSVRHSPCQLVSHPRRVSVPASLSNATRRSTGMVTHHHAFDSKQP